MTTEIPSSRPPRIRPRSTLPQLEREIATLLDKYGAENLRAQCHPPLSQIEEELALLPATSVKGGPLPPAVTIKSLELALVRQELGDRLGLRRPNTQDVGAALRHKLSLYVEPESRADSLVLDYRLHLQKLFTKFGIEDKRQYSKNGEWPAFR